MNRKNQKTSGVPQKASAREWADEVIAIAENPTQGGLEIRFNAEPSPQLQPKLRVHGFRHSRTMTMWYGDKSAEALKFAEQVKTSLPTSPDGPDLFLSPSFDAIKSNIEKKEFSFIIITLNDGRLKNFIVFEPSKPRAEVIAMNFAKQEFPDQFLALAAKPKTHIREARMLFDEGKIIGENEVVSRQKTIHPENKTSREIFAQSDKIPVREVWLTTKESNLQPLYKEGKTYSAWSGADLFVKGLIGKFSDVYYKVIWQDGESIEGSVDLEPVDFYKDKEEILSTHIQNYVFNLSKIQPSVLYSKKAIEKAKKILEGYELQHIPLYTKPLAKSSPTDLTTEFNFKATGVTGDIVFNPYIMAKYIMKSDKVMLYHQWVGRFGAESLKGRAFSKDERQYLREFFTVNVLNNENNERSYKEIYDQTQNKEYEDRPNTEYTNEVEEKIERERNGWIHTRSEKQRAKEKFKTLELKQPLTAKEAFNKNAAVIDLVQRFDEVSKEFQENFEKPITRQIRETSTKLNKLKASKSKEASKKKKQLKDKLTGLETKLAWGENIIQDEYTTFQDELFDEVVQFAKDLGFSIESEPISYNVTYLDKDGEVIDTTEIDENNEELARSLYKEFGHDPMQLVRIDIEQLLSGLPGINSFRDRVMEGLLDNRMMENYFKEPVKKMAEEFIREYFKDKDTNASVDVLIDKQETLVDIPVSTKSNKKDTEDLYPLTNDSGVYTEASAGKNLEHIEIPFPKDAKFRASIEIAKTSLGEYKFGIDAAKLFGDAQGIGWAASIDGQSYSTRKEALTHAFKFIYQRIELLIATEDSILHNEKQKKKQLEKALSALKAFGEQQGIAMSENWEFVDEKKKSANFIEKNPKPPKINQLELNKSIEEYIDAKDKEKSVYSATDKIHISQYTGSGGLIKQGATGKGILYEYYTPDLVIERMWGLAYQYGFTTGRILEPSVGTGHFLKYAPKDAVIYGFETNHYSARIAQILYPQAQIFELPFETIFFSGNVHLKDDFDKDHPFDLVIGNPPYGEFSGKYAGMGEKKWTGAAEYDQYFLTRGLDLLKPAGLLVFIIPSNFFTNDSKYDKLKEKIAAKADLLDAYRLPARTFDTTDIGTDIVVFKRK